MIISPVIGNLALMVGLLATCVMADGTSGADSSNPPLVIQAFNYMPSKPAAAVAGTLYFVASLGLFTRLVISKSWWGLCLPIAAVFTSTGFYVRVALDSSPNSTALFTVQQLFIIVSPAAFLAFNYILYGRLIVQCVSPRHSFIRPQWVARIFVISDIYTFLVQGGGGGLASSSDLKTAKAGVRILLIGLIVQTVSYGLFIALVGHAHGKIIKDDRTTGLEPWWKIIWLLYFSSFFISIRCIYRLIEFAQGDGGFLLVHEIYFYVLDALPLLLAISVYVPFWPAKYISSDTEAYKMEETVEV